MYYFLKNYTKCRPREKLPSDLLKENYNRYYIERLFTSPANFPTKKTCHWWVTWRKWGFTHKYLKINIKWSRCANISNYRWISQVQMQLAKISQVEIIHFTSCKIVLQLINSLSCSDSFPLFTSQVVKILQVGFHNLRNCWMVDFFCAFLPCILVWIWKRVMKLQSLVSSWIWASTWFAMNYTKISLILGLFWWSKSYQKHQNLTQFD